MKTYLLFFILLFSVVLQAQTNFDSLAQIANTSTGKDKADMLNHMATMYNEITNTKQAFKYANEALDLSTLILYDRGIATAYNNISNTYIAMSKLDSAIIMANNALDISESLEYKRGICDAYRNKGIAFSYQNKFKEAENLLNRSITLSEKIEYKYGEASGYTSIAIIYGNTGRTAEALRSNILSAEIFHEMGFLEKTAHSYLNIGSLYTTILFNFEKGLEYNLKALEIFNQVGAVFKSGYCMLILGTIYDELDQPEDALRYYENAYFIFKNAKNDILISITYNNIGETYKNQKKYKKAIEYYIKSLELNTKLKREVGNGVALNNLGECSYALGDYSTALNYFNRSLQILTQLNDVYKIAIVKTNLAKLYRDKKQYNKAITLVNEAVKNATDAEATKEIAEAAKLKSELYELTGDYKKSLEAFKLYDEQIILVNQNKSSQEVAKFQVEFETEKKEKEIALLKKNQVLDRAELRHRNYLTYSFVIVATLLAVLVTLLYNKNKYKSKAELELKERNEKISTQKEQLEKINNELININRQLALSENEQKKANEIKNILFSIISHDLRSPFTAILGISEALYEDAAEMTPEEISQMSLDLHEASSSLYVLLDNLLNWSKTQMNRITPSKEVVKVSQSVKGVINIYKSSISKKNITVDTTLLKEYELYVDKEMFEAVLRNLFHNAIKFSPDYGKISIWSEFDRSRYSIVIKDEGIGIPTDLLKKLYSYDSDVRRPGTQNEKGVGLGLVLSKKFIEINNGALEISSDKNDGTKARISISTK